MAYNPYTGNDPRRHDFEQRQRAIEEQTRLAAETNELLEEQSHAAQDAADEVSWAISRSEKSAHDRWWASATPDAKKQWAIRQFKSFNDWRFDSVFGAGSLQEWQTIFHRSIHPALAPGQEMLETELRILFEADIVLFLDSYRDVTDKWVAWARQVVALPCPGGISRLFGSTHPPAPAFPNSARRLAPIVERQLARTSSTQRARQPFPQPSAHVEYFFSQGGDDRHGPLSYQQLSEVGIEATTWIWRAGLSKWIAAQELPELASILRPQITELDEAPVPGKRQQPGKEDSGIEMSLTD